MTSTESVSDRGYRVRVKYPILDVYRYLALDGDGWYTGDRDKGRIFETAESADMAIQQYCHMLNSTPLTGMRVEVEPIPAFDPDWVTQPKEHLLETLKSMGVEPHAFGSFQTDIQGVLDNDQPITYGLAEVLGQKLGISKMYWLNLEHNYREGLKKGLKVL